MNNDDDQVLDYDDDEGPMLFGREPPPVRKFEEHKVFDLSDYDLFYCARFRAKLSPQTCGRRWRSREKLFPGVRMGCESCPIGEKNAKRVKRSKGEG